MSFILATWNILATAYIRREWYPRTQRQFLDPSWRVPALASRALDLGADILCLQEVEESAFTVIANVLEPAGYIGAHVLKDRNRPDGCATFVRSGRFEIAHVERVAYRDGEGCPDSGHILQLIVVEHEGRRLAIGNTHLKWDPPGTEPRRQWGYRQARQALEALAGVHGSSGQVLCGDLNVTPDSSVVELLTGAGFDYAHRACPDARTCNSNARARLIDHLFYRGSLRVTPLAPGAIEDLTSLPSAQQPSDHLPLAARFDWSNI